MTNREFNKLTVDELLLGLKLCAKNAERHFDSALTLSDKNYYGIANSHLILSAEEAVKGLLFLIKILHKKDFVDIEPIYKDHKQKHYVAKGIYDSWKHLMDSYAEAIMTALQNIDKLYDKDLETVARATTQLVEENLKYRMTFNNDEERKRIKKWWNKANDKKNQGFYIDYNNKKWILSGDLTESEFLESKEIVGKIISPILLMAELKESDVKLITKLYDEKAKLKTATNRLTSPANRT